MMCSKCMCIITRRFANKLFPSGRILQNTTTPNYLHMGDTWISVTKTKIVEYSWVTANFKEFMIILEVQNWALFCICSFTLNHRMDFKQPHNRSTQSSKSDVENPQKGVHEIRRAKWTNSGGRPKHASGAQDMLGDGIFMNDWRA